MSNDAKMMRELVREAAREPVPEVDWNRVEQRLFEQIEREPAPSPRRQTPAWRPIVAVAAVAASIAAAASFASEQSPVAARSAARVAEAPAQPQAASRLASGVIEASTVHEGDRLVAGVGALTVQHPGQASWVLANTSVVRIERLDSVIVIDLEAGSVRVEVEPRQQAESFVVRVGDTAVSVHGTIFTVEKRGDRALVQVLRGSVAVGPRSRRGQAMGWLMVAPSSATFSASGLGEPEFGTLPLSALQESDRALPGAQPLAGARPEAPAVANEEPAHPAAPGAQVPRPQNAAPVAPVQPEPQAQNEPVQQDPSLPETLTDAAARSSLDAARAGIADCHRRLGAVGGDGVRVQVQSKLTIMVAPDGHVTTGRFDPPLAREVQSCAGAVLLSTVFPKARSASTLVLALHF
jgi:hypothetical protein